MSIRIPYTTEHRLTYYDFDLMMSVNTGRHKLMAGKYIETGTRNGLILFFKAIILILLSAFFRFLFPDVDPLFSEILGGVGIVIIFLDLILTAGTKYSYRKMMQAGDIKADVVFDEKGIHAWETPQRGFDAGWDAVTHCFITKKWIFILFKNRHVVVDLPYTKENKEIIIAGFKEGHKLESIKFLSVEKGKVTVRNK